MADLMWYEDESKFNVFLETAHKICVDGFVDPSVFDQFVAEQKIDYTKYPDTSGIFKQLRAYIAKVLTDPFKPATVKDTKVKMAISGLPKSGKTFTALSIATNAVKLVYGDSFDTSRKVALIDTEHKSASKYARYFKFSTTEITNHHPNNYITAINKAVEYGYEWLIIDSFSAAWNGIGGVLQIVEEEKNKSTNKNSFTSGWSKGTPLQNRFIDAILAAPLNIIATMRVKMEYEISKDENGRTTPKQIGLAPIQRDMTTYEFDILSNVNEEHVLSITGTRCSELDGRAFANAGKDVAEILMSWISEEGTEF